MELVQSPFPIYDDYGLFAVDSTLCFEPSWYCPSSPFSGGGRREHGAGFRIFFTIDQSTTGAVLVPQ